MKTKSILLLALIIGFLISCEKNNDNGSKFYSFSGKVQKGPFVTGTNVTLNEMNSNLGQTGRSFNTTISNDDGSFSLNNIELSSNLSLLTANGFYFSEIYGELSGATLSLQAIADISDKESVNINVLTHLAKSRIENLVAGGLSFNDANEQAKSEISSFLGDTESSQTNFESMDISRDGESNALLLAFSVILQRHTNNILERPKLTAELTQLLSNLSSDLAPDGQITDNVLIDTLLFNISQLNLINVRNNIVEKYSQLGQSVTIPDFENYITQFQEKYSDTLYAGFFYPDSASPDPTISPDAKLPNLLVPSDTIFDAWMPYSIAAIIPLNSSLKIKFIANDNYAISIIHGWELIND